MALFESAIQQVNSAVGTVASLIWDTDNTSATAFGPLGSITAGNVLKDVTIINQGSVPVYVGMGSAAAAATTGVQIPAGGQLTLQGYNVTSTASSATGDIWGQTAVVGTTGATVVGLATVASVA